MRIGIRSVAALGFLMAATAAIFSWSQLRSGNVILVVVDTLRADALGCYGSKNRTPNLDRLAISGTKLDPVVGSFHQTTGSMGAMFTGRTPSMENSDGSVLPWNGENWCGQARFGTGAPSSRCLSENIPTLGERMKVLGYHTVAAVGNSFLFRPAGFDRGFDEWREVGSREAKRDSESLAAYARRMASLRSGAVVVDAALDALRRPFVGPLFLYVHLMDVHDWWTPGDASHSLRHVQNYGLAVERLDRHVGNLFGKLREAGVMKGATVVVVADHGESLGEPHPIPSQVSHQGNPTYEPVSRVPFLLCRMDDGGGDPWFPDGQELLRTQDLYSVILRLGGDSGPFSGSVLRGDEVYYTELGFRTLRRGHWKITCPRSDSQGCALFDLGSDALESTNLASVAPDTRQELVARMDELSRRISHAPRATGATEMSVEDRRRLQALGYLQ